MIIKAIKTVIEHADETKAVRLCFIDEGPSDFEIEFESAAINEAGDLVIYAQLVYDNEGRRCPNCDSVGTLFDTNNRQREECGDCGLSFTPAEVDAYQSSGSEE